ncbi:MAG TPA: oxidoreductase [Gemmatimonadaceae bacterium]|jgi:NAD(P)-dependent dehydrogenase (short-subunit alcohol dehydrogenase family)
MTRTAQHPIPSGFNEATTAREVLDGVDLRGRTAIVTGGYAGVGRETTRALTNAGATVVVAGRSLEKGREALKDIPGVELELLDLIDPKSVDAFAERFVASKRPLHLLINNAGIMAAPLMRDARGVESQLATNHVGHFQLTLRLWPALLAAQGARVVALSSRGHARSAFDFDDPQFDRRPYDKWSAYGQSKTANALFATALDVRGEAHNIRAFSAHPGAIATTDLMRSMSKEEQAAAIERAKGGTFKSEEQGAATSVWCATSSQLIGMGGVYCEDVDIARAVAADDPGLIGVRPWAMDADAAERLWRVTEDWTGLSI